VPNYRYVPGRGALGQMDTERLIAEAQQLAMGTLTEFT